MGLPRGEDLQHLCSEDPLPLYPHPGVCAMCPPTRGSFLPKAM